jgi:hypothetical protein
VTADEERRFGQFVALLDSDQQGERASALEKIFTLRPQYNFPKFGDVLHKLNNTASLADYKKLLADYQKLENDLANCLHHYQILRAVVNIKTVLAWVLRVAIYVSVGSGIGYGAYCLFWPDRSAADELAHAVLAEMRPGLARANKAAGDSKPIVHLIDGKPFWIIVRTEVDATSHVDRFDEPAPRICQHYFVSAAEYDETPPAGFLLPQPYTTWLFHRLRWPELGTLCQQSSSP